MTVPHVHEIYLRNARKQDGPRGRLTKLAARIKRAAKRRLARRLKLWPVTAETLDAALENMDATRAELVDVCVRNEIGRIYADRALKSAAARAEANQFFSDVIKRLESDNTTIVNLDDLRPKEDQ